MVDKTEILKIFKNTFEYKGKITIDDQGLVSVVGY